VAEDDGITGISLNGVRKLIEDKKLPEDLLDTFNLITDAVIALSPLALGPVGAALLWPMLEPKHDLVDAAKTAIKKLTKSRPSHYVDQARRFAAANALLTYTAFFDALSLYEPDFIRKLELTEADKARIAAQAAPQALGLLPEPGSAAPSFMDIVKVPHPVAANDTSAIDFRWRLYMGMAQGALGSIVYLTERAKSVRGAPADAVVDLGWPTESDLHSAIGGEHLGDLDRVAVLAESVYQAEFLGMAIDYQPFSVWATLQDQADKDALLRKLSDDLRAAGEDNQLRFELLGAALHNLDLGLDRLSRAIAAQPAPSSEGPLLPESKAAKAAEALRNRYADDVNRPVIDDRYDPPTGGPRLKYPGSAEAYVPQAYRQVRYAVGGTHLERDDEWAKFPAADDLGPAITRYLESPYSTESPLLILGHPGSGKSLLTRVYAARLEYPRYTVVRVELRDANPDVSIQKQVEDQIYKDTGYSVNWADLTDNLPWSPPIVILDGYDELLQATGKLFTDYLDKVQRFQREALVQHRPVRVIVTSRITLIDKAIIPPGTTVMRLEPFDEPRRTEWITRWNACNTAAYFQQSGVKPFRLPDNRKVVELAEQPLLLLMLAIFDSAGNPLSDRPDLDQTLLYDELLRRFIERELGKGEHGTAFSGLPPEERRPMVDKELHRLGVAAIGMFNRQEVKTLRDQLDRDLAYFGAERQGTSGLYGQSQSELLLGSFFFIHESRSRLALNGTANATQQAATAGKHVPGPTAFEFLHNTFGEFLAADFILRHVIENAAAIRDLTGKPTLEHARQQHLTSLTPHWWACLLYTPLHTRPNILTLFREWSAHRLPADPSARAALLSALDEVVRTQLRTVLTGTDALDLAARARSATPSEPTPTAPPYDPLPVFGHAAVYTLNLILLRTHLADEQLYELDESALDAGDRPWDRLTALWRSWFTLESLGALAEQLTATRMDNQLTLAPTWLGSILTPSSPLDTAYNAAKALADNLTAASMGLHIASQIGMGNASFLLLELLGRSNDETPELALIRDSLLRRLDGYQPELPALVSDELTQIDDGISGLMLSFAEFTDRAVLAPRQRAEIPVSRGDLTQLAGLSRYASAVITHLCADLDSHWLRRLLLSKDDMQYEDFVMAWRELLRSPAAAPVLRAAVAQLSAALCADVAGLLRGMLPDGDIALFDVDTAAALAVLAWRGSDAELCARTLDALLRGCEHDAWNLLDIPLETWDGLADLFAEAGSVMASRRSDFVAVLDTHLAGFAPVTGVTPYERSRKLADVWLHALRIGSVRHREYILPFLITLVAVGTPSRERRRWFLLLLRWARENDETQSVRQLFIQAADPNASPWWIHFGAARDAGPAAIDLDRAPADLTYREAMDLRWALDIWRESGAHWRGEPTDAESASQSSPRSAKRRRSRG
jgi:hypothetical protein